MLRILPRMSVASLALRRSLWPALQAMSLGVLLLLVGCGGGNAPSPPASLVGSWGGTEDSDRTTPVTLQVTATGAELQFPCQKPVVFSQPLQPDSSGHFSVTGVETYFLHSGSDSVRMEGAVSGRVMTLQLFYSGSTTPVMTSTVGYGIMAPAFNGGCPG